MEALPCTLDAVATARICAEWRKQQLEFVLHLEQLKNGEDVRGGAFQLQAKLAFQREIRYRAQFAWSTLHSLLIASGVLRRPLADAIKRKIREVLTVDSPDLAIAWSYTPGLQSEDFGAQREPLIAEVFAEVDFGIDAQDRARERLVKRQIIGTLVAAIVGGLVTLAGQAWLGGHPVVVSCENGVSAPGGTTP